jgi:DNA-binding Xre family transcriptional regulator
MLIDRAVLIKKIKTDLRAKSQPKLADEIGMELMTLNRVVRQGEIKSLKTWELLSKHYSRN